MEASHWSGTGLYIASLPNQRSSRADLQSSWMLLSSFTTGSTGYDISRSAISIPVITLIPAIFTPFYSAAHHHITERHCRLKLKVSGVDPGGVLLG